MRKCMLLICVVALFASCEDGGDEVDDFSGVWNVQVHKERSGPMIQHPIDTTFASTIEVTQPHQEEVDARLTADNFSRTFTLLPDTVPDHVLYRYMGSNPFQVCYIFFFPSNDSIYATFGEGYLGGSTSWVMKGRR